MSRYIAKIGEKEVVAEPKASYEGGPYWSCGMYLDGVLVAFDTWQDRTSRDAANEQVGEWLESLGFTKSED